MSNEKTTDTGIKTKNLQDIDGGLVAVHLQATILTTGTEISTGGLQAHHTLGLTRDFDLVADARSEVIHHPHLLEVITTLLLAALEIRIYLLLDNNLLPLRIVSVGTRISTLHIVALGHEKGTTTIEEHL